MNDNITIIDSSDVGFVPERFFPTWGDLSVATASCLLREFATCPDCGAGIDPDVADGVQSDRDVVWTSEHTNCDRRQAIDRSNAHVCQTCQTPLRLFVEEKAQPAQWSEIPNERWASRHLWIEMDNGNYFVTNPTHITARVERTDD